MPISRSQITQHKGVIITAGIIIFGVFIAIICSLIIAATAQPAKNDYVHFENQRNIVDISMEVYDQTFSEFTSAYQTSFQEGQPTKERQALKEAFLEKLESEKQISGQRIKAMDNSIVLKNQQVRKDYDTFKAAYVKASNYIDKYIRTSTVIIEAVSGSCGKVTKLEVTDKKYAENFVKASDECLAKLADAKKNTSGSSEKMLSDLEKLFKERRDKFKEVVDEKDAYERKMASTLALISILGVNSELQSIQAAYEAATLKESNSVSDNFDQTSKTLSKTLTKLSGSDASKERKQ